MRTFRIALIVAATLTGAAATFCADAVAWGPDVNGMRLGIGLGPVSSETRLRVLFQNVGSAEQDLVISEDFYNLRFTATALDGKEYQVFDVRLLAAGPSPGLVVSVWPVVVRLNSGEIRDLGFSLKTLICVVDRKDMTVDTLLPQQYSLHAHFEVDAKGVGGAVHPWIGRITSAEFSSQK